MCFKSARYLNNCSLFVYFLPFMDEILTLLRLKSFFDSLEENKQGFLKEKSRVYTKIKKSIDFLLIKNNILFLF